MPAGLDVGAWRNSTNNPPVDWAALSAEQAAAQWPILARWVGDVLVPRYELTRDELPDCWALHPPVVAELSWLRTAYVQAYLTGSPPQLSADWHTRWRPAVLTRIRELIKPDECSPGKHAPRRGTPIELAAQNGALPRTQLAEPPCWWPFYDRAFHLDLAVRRARAAAGELNWSPARERLIRPVTRAGARAGSLGPRAPAPSVTTNGGAAVVAFTSSAAGRRADPWVPARGAVRVRQELTCSPCQRGPSAPRRVVTAAATRGHGGAPPLGSGHDAIATDAEGILHALLVTVLIKLGGSIDLHETDLADDAMGDQKGRPALDRVDRPALRS